MPLIAMTEPFSNPSPSLALYAELERAFAHFNAALFDGKLPPCLITMRAGGRYYGYHHKERFINAQGEMVDELALHPGFFSLRPIEEVLSTLVHEMVHHWQAHFGHASKSNPHNREWARKMRDIGLEPSSTGLPEGKDTGRTVSHYIVPNGPFLQACQSLLLQGFALSWFDRHLPRSSLLGPADEPELATQTVQAAQAQRQEQLAKAGADVALSQPPVLQLLAQQQEAAEEGEADERLRLTPPAPPLLAPAPPRPVDRLRYACPQCAAAAWGKSGLEIVCGRCEVGMETAS